MVDNLQPGMFVILAILIALTLSKFFKFFHYKNAKNALLAGGGMPSSHCASAAALLTMIGLLEGFTTTFALALAFAVVVFVDAVRVRRAVGINANILKKLSKNKDIMVENGHTIPEAIIGTLLGIVVSVLLYAVVL